MPDTDPQQAQPVVLITGGNAGLGLAIAQSLASSPTAYTILIGTRNEQKGQDAIRTIQASVPQTASKFSVVRVDLTSDTSLEAAAAQIESEHGRLDVLVNNAGANIDAEVLTGQKTLSTREAWNTSWDINVTGTMVLTELLIPLLLKSSDPRLLFLTSGTASCGETVLTEGPIYSRLNTSPEAGWPKPPPRGLGTPAYRAVKTGLNMMMLEWNRILRSDGVKVWAISPGILATGLGGLGAERMKAMGAKDPAEGGDLVRSVVEGKFDGETGTIVRHADYGPQKW